MAGAGKLTIVGCMSLSRVISFVIFHEEKIGSVKIPVMCNMERWKASPGFSHLAGAELFHYYIYLPILLYFKQKISSWCLETV